MPEFPNHSSIKSSIVKNIEAKIIEKFQSCSETLRGKRLSLRWTLIIFSEVGKRSLRLTISSLITA